ncbi:MAG: NAD(P)H-dependent oxidoreductase subunit E [Anaerolineae bacterium]
MGEDNGLGPVGPGLRSWVEGLWRELGSAFAPGMRTLERLLAQQPRIWGGNGAGRSVLLEVLHEAQAMYGGWLPRPVLTRIARALDVPLSDVYGVTGFCTMFYTEPVGKKIIRICEDAPCVVQGAAKVEAALCQHLQIKPGQTTPDGEYTLERVRCLGLCDHAPAVLVNETRHLGVAQPSHHPRALSATPRATPNIKPTSAG